jgi:ABC-type sugar transport system ATPase subunit
MPSLVIDDVTKDYGAFRAIRGVSLSVEQGEFIVMVGPSGCGKSTLLRIVAGLESITAGRVVIGGREVTRLEPADRGVAMVFQNYALYPHMTVAQNMGFGLKMSGRSRAEVDAAVRRAASILRITEQLGIRPKELSGPEAARRHRPRHYARRRSFCLTSRSPISMPRCARRCVSSFRVCTPAEGNDGLRHARPDGSDDDGGPHRGPERGRRRANRFAARTLQSPW